MKGFGAARNLAQSFLTDLSHEQYLSDEVSGPDDESGESHDAWKVRCAVAANMTTDASALAKIKFLEVLTPAWRSTEVRARFLAYQL